jgi:hypothetical protein
MENLAEVKRNLSKLRADLYANITDFMHKHNCKELDVTEFDSTPIILEDLERYDYSYTLDRITYNGANSRVYCSNCEDNDSFYITSLGIDTLTDLYEWLLDNEEFFDFGEE